MDHADATQLGAVEKYLLDELPPELRDEFEDHYFDCQECATDLRATTAFMEAAKSEFRAHPLLAKPTPARSRFTLFRGPILVASALAASLLVIVYQNVVVYPHLESELAQLESPAVLPSVYLAAGASRGGSLPSVTVNGMRPFQLTFDIPAQAIYSSYTCSLYAPSGALDWRYQVSSQMAKDAVTIIAPAAHRAPGTYTLVVQGNGATPAVELERTQFTLVIQK
jgi:hypothetical protein